MTSFGMTNEAGCAGSMLRSTFSVQACQTSSVMNWLIGSEEIDCRWVPSMSCYEMPVTIKTRIGPTYSMEIGVISVTTSELLHLARTVDSDYPISPIRVPDSAGRNYPAPPLGYWAVPRLLAAIRAPPDSAPRLQHLVHDLGALRQHRPDLPPVDRLGHA